MNPLIYDKRVRVTQLAYKFVLLPLKLKRQIMFGDMMGMMGKLKETQEKVEATKKRLETVFIEESASDDLVKVTISANRKIHEIKIDDGLLEDKEQLEDYLVVTINKAIQRATQVNETELAAVAKEGMPNIPGLDSLFGK